MAFIFADVAEWVKPYGHLIKPITAPEVDGSNTILGARVGTHFLDQMVVFEPSTLASQIINAKINGSCRGSLCLLLFL